MAFSPAACVIDNDMLGATMRTLVPAAVDDRTLDVAEIGEAVRGDGHFLGRPAPRHAWKPTSSILKPQTAAPSRTGKPTARTTFARSPPSVPVIFSATTIPVILLAQSTPTCARGLT